MTHASAPPRPSPAGGERASSVTGRAVLPHTAPGLRVGLLGGSFNPPHAAHRAVSLFAMKRLGLDRVWWLVTPGNPLKDLRVLPPIGERVAAARAFARHPRIDVTDIEARIGTRYTADTLAFLVRRCPHVRFVWLMGADNLRDFHHWDRWRHIFDLVPIAVVDRGRMNGNALSAPAAHALSRYRVPESEAARLPGLAPPAWCFLHGLKLPLSSTMLRARRAANVCAGSG
ncbi:MAG: nicotinate-nucleotide adenylyltransferase [Variibacter sp.]